MFLSGVIHDGYGYEWCHLHTLFLLLVHLSTDVHCAWVVPFVDRAILPRRLDFLSCKAETTQACGRAQCPVGARSACRSSRGMAASLHKDGHQRAHLAHSQTPWQMPLHTLLKTVFQKCSIFQYHPSRLTFALAAHGVQVAHSYHT